MKYIAIAIISSATLALASPVLASGSMGGGAPGGQLGQKVYMQKVACSGCPFAGGLKTRDQVNMALAKIDSGEIKMSGSEKKAVTAFINRRFKGL
jgi:hypothetical protein